ncbi:MAG TPA: flagellar assembly peptidoglycan hydrolase FlgJ [Rhodocyclaceae bacterium]|nr:flagellar assembly peptidoglycan hydrolase FlgJ [Rhodocyclaceae bacterium]
MAIKVQNTPNRLAADVKGTQDLREKFQKDPKAGLQAAAQQFESMFLQMVMKSMRDATPQDGLFNSDQSRFYTSMLDQQLAQNMASGRGVGFAKLIEQQLGRTLQAGDGLPKVPGENDMGGKAAMPPANGAGNALPLSASDGRHLPAGPSLGPVGASLSSRATAALAAYASNAGSSSSSAKDFVSRVWPHAVEASRSTGIPPQFLVAHAALESGWGKHEPRSADGSPTFNLFGVKAGKSWNGGAVDVPTTEYVDGQRQKVNDKFRSYGSYAEAFKDYANLLRNNPKYGNVVGSQDGTEFAKRLQQAGYATDPSYAEKLARIINGPTLRQALIG